MRVLMALAETRDKGIAVELWHMGDEESNLATRYAAGLESSLGFLSSFPSRSVGFAVGSLGEVGWDFIAMTVRREGGKGWEGY